jgi:hypothetical protein
MNLYGHVQVQIYFRTFFFQTKDPRCFQKYQFPKNVILGITLETNRDKDYNLVSKALIPSKRVLEFIKVEHPRKTITIEPIIKFDLIPLINMVKLIKPIRVYVGYDTKRSHLNEPKLAETNQLIEMLSKITTVKLKLIRESHIEVIT